MCLRLGGSGLTNVDQVTAIVLGGRKDHASIQFIIQTLKNNCGSVRVLIADRNINSEIDSSPDDGVYFMKLNESDPTIDLHQVMKRAIEIAPDSTRFFIFEDAGDLRFSESVVKRIVKRGLDFRKLASRTTFMSKRYLLHVLETGEAPTATNAARGGFVSQMSITDMLRSPREAIGQNSTLVSFALVGASGVGVNLLVLTIFKSLVGALLANIMAQELSIVSNFVWNDRFTFKSRAKTSRFLALPRLYRFVKYNLVSLLSLAVNETVFFIAYSHGVFYIYSSLIAIATAFIVNYLGSSRWAWTKTALQLAKD